MKNYDLVVVGGGLSGVAAAVAAAREGLKVLIVERSGALGGALNTALVYPFMRYWTEKEGERKYLSRGIFEEMVRRHNETYKKKTFKEHYFHTESFKLILDEMTEECGVEVLFHTMLAGVSRKDRNITHLSLCTKAGLIEVAASFYVDATGDGDLMYQAGCDFQLGREKDNLCQPMTTCFRVAGVDEEKLAEQKTLMQEKYKEQQQEGKIQNPRENILLFMGPGKGIVHLNTTRVVRVDPTDPFARSKAEMAARKQVFEMMELFKQFSAFENAELVSVATEIGIRESRKLKGEHILSAEELKNCTRFEDSIALGNYDIDIHNPEGAGTSHYYFAPGDYYTIPYRTLLPKEYDNLLVAGRCVSATHEAQASIRIMPICCCLGEAAGVAVSVAKQTDTNTHTLSVKALQQKLLDNGGAL